MKGISHKNARLPEIGSICLVKLPGNNDVSRFRVHSYTEIPEMQNDIVIGFGTLEYEMSEYLYSDIPFIHQIETAAQVEKRIEDLKRCRSNEEAALKQGPKEKTSFWGCLKDILGI